jgi:NADPH2:quinone reductase
MKAWRVHELGPHREVLRLEDAPIPTPGEGETLVRVRAAGVNFPDTLVIAGKYQVRPPLPFTPGFECVGDDTETGERVLCWAARGAFQEHAVVRRDQMLRAPAALTDVEAAGWMVSYQTAYFALVHRGQLRAGEVLLVIGGAGAIGSAAIQLGKVLGATVIATASTPAKAEICRQLGADRAIDISQLPEAARGADVILDPVGGAAFEAALRSIAFEGRLVVIGFTSGTIPSIPVNRILLKTISVTGLYWADYWDRAPERIHATHTLLARLPLKPLVGKVFPLEALPDALDAVLDRASYGKHVIVV